MYSPYSCTLKGHPYINLSIDLTNKAFEEFILNSTSTYPAKKQHYYIIPLESI